MQDEIILGTGNSRYLKSAVPSGTTWEQALSMLQDGTFPIDLNGKNAAGIAQQGTPLNKANLLSDETAAMLGLGTDATVDDALKMAGGAEITVITTPSSEVTATNGASTLSATANEYGAAVLRCTFGEWTVSSIGRSATVTVDVIRQYTVSLATVDDFSWSIISDIAQSGQADLFFDIGDTKKITLNGTIGTVIYPNAAVWVFILMFNCPINKTTADNNIIWGGFKTSRGTDVGLDDANYGANPTTGTISFNMNHWWNTSTYGSNYGGWKGCDLRYDILGSTERQASGYGAIKSSSNVGYDATTAAITSPKSNTLMAALPSDFRSALRLWTRWVDNVGNSSNVDANVTACVDAGISLLTEFEVHGTRTYANQYEQNHQVQMTYYANGNSKIKYRQGIDNTAAVWWLSSPYYGGSTDFCSVRTDGSATSRYAYNSCAVAPAFKT